MTRAALSKLLAVVTVVSLAAVVVLTWLDAAPFAAELASNEITLVPADNKAVNEALSVDSDLLRLTTEVKLAGARIWPRPSGTAVLDQVDLLPPYHRSCGALNVALAPAGAGRSVLRLKPSLGSGKNKDCDASWQLVLGVGSESPTPVAIENGSTIELIFRDPQGPAHVLHAFAAAALRAARLHRVSGSSDSTQTLATEADMAGEIQIGKLATEPVKSVDGARLTMVVRVFATASTRISFSGDSLHTHRLVQKIMSVSALTAGVLVIMMQILTLLSKAKEEQAVTPEQPAAKSQVSSGPTSNSSAGQGKEPAREPKSVRGGQAAVPVQSAPKAPVPSPAPENAGSTTGSMPATDFKHER
jgi:hypothetical protein